MKCRALKMIVVLLAGAIINVAVAWACAISVSPSMVSDTMPATLAGRSFARVGRSGLYNDGERIALGPDEHFFIGDNVEKSADSRMYGPTRTTAIAELSISSTGRFRKCELCDSRRRVNCEKA